MIISEISKQRPEDKETISFGKNSTETGKLIKFVDHLENYERFTYKKYGIGRNAIKDMVLTHVRERRQAQKDAKICESASDTGTMSASADESSSSNGSPPGLFDKKRKEYVSYFNPGKGWDKLRFIIVVV